MSGAATLASQILPKILALSVALVSRNGEPVRCRHEPSRQLLDLECKLETWAAFGTAQLVEVGPLNLETPGNGVAREPLRVHPS